MLKCIILTLQVVKVVQVRKNVEALSLLRVVQDELIGQQTKVRELITHSFVFLHCEFKDKPAKSTSRNQYAQPLSCFLIVGHFAKFLDKIRIHFLDQWLKALGSLLFA